MLLTIDFALRCSGWAVWDAGHLLDTGIVRVSDNHMLIVELSHALPELNENDRVIIERPRYYSRSASGRSGERGNPQDNVVEPNFYAGKLAMCFEIQGCFVDCIWPSDWSRIDKEIQNARDWDKLSADEQDRVYRLRSGKNRGKYSPDAMDAVGIGLWYYKKRGGRYDASNNSTP